MSSVSRYAEPTLRRDPRAIREWIAALGGHRPVPDKLVADVRSNPGRTIGTVPVPGRVEPVEARAAASILTAAFDDVRIASGCGGPGSWIIEATDEPSTILLLPLKGRFRVRRSDQVALLAPSAAVFVTDDQEVVVEALDDDIQLLTAIVPAARARSLHEDFVLRGLVPCLATPDLRATSAYLGALLVGTLIDDAPAQPRVAGIVATLVASLAEATLAASGRGSRSTEVRHAALRAIERRHRATAFGVDDVARELFISRRQLYRAFPDAGGIAGIIAQHRLHTAERLMRDQPGLQLSEVATLAGFSTAGVMRAHFRRVYGTTPQQHRDGPTVNVLDSGATSFPIE